MKLINDLRFSNVRGDIYDGITAGAVTLALALAIGVSSGAMFVGLFAVLFSGTLSQVSGPTDPMTVVMDSRCC